YGLMTEEINHSYDGGLYAELIRNRTFRASDRGPAHWTAVADRGAVVSLALDRNVPLNAALRLSLRVDAASASEDRRAGVANGGYWGIPVRAGEIYSLSLYAKGSPGFDGPIDVSLESADGSEVFAAGSVGPLTMKWARYALKLRPARSAAGLANRLVLAVHRPGTFWLQVVSLFPPTYHGRPNGNRIDLMRMLAALHPGFLRFPGGNYLEGNTIAERFPWKRSLGPIADRPGHESPWGYWSDDGMGLLEYLEWCEDLHMEPVLAVYAGFSLDHELVKPGAPLRPFVEDALQEIQYVTGGTDTTWGARRARDGHPAPFRLRYVEIGNEDFFDRTGSYDARFAQFFDAIKARYPRLQLIATTPVSSRRPDVIDEHFYKTAEDFYGMTHRYDTYERSGPKIFVGEWATREGTPKGPKRPRTEFGTTNGRKEIAPTPNLNAALGDFAWMTGLERNADLVIMNSYAPLLVNVNPGASQWAINLIGYNAGSAYGSPSYYAQRMFNTHRGTRVVPAAMADVPGFFYSTTLTPGRGGRLYLKAVNSTGSPIEIAIRVAGANLAPDGRQIVLTSDNPNDTNTIADPTKIVPAASPLKVDGPAFRHTFPPYSDDVLILPVR
ncbi:MAG: alpha-L-arabinofuranosidase C-terminal domain-containing protein, partial [Opitutaceae bacterium]